MFTVMLVKEIRNHLMTFRFAAALVTTFILIIVSVWVLGDDYSRRRDTYTRLVDTYNQEMNEQYIPSRVFPRLHRAPAPLSIFAQGEGKNLGNSVEIRRWAVPVDADDSLTDNMLLAALPSFDLLAIFTLIISLFGILMNYDGLCGERESGVLKLICTYPPSRGQIYLVKFLGGVIVLVIPLAISLISSLIVLQFFHGIIFSADQWGALSLMLLIGIFYGALFVAIGLMTSTLVKRSSTSLVLSLLIWVLGVMIVPISATSIAQASYDLPPVAEISTFSYQTRQENINKRREYYSTEAPEAGWGFGGYNTFGEGIFLFDTSPDRFRQTGKLVLFQEKMWQERADQIWKLQKKLLDEKRNQYHLADALASIAPAHQLRKAFTSLAGTSYKSYGDFMEKARRYREHFLKTYENKGFFSHNVLQFFTRRPLEEINDNEGFEQRVAEYRKKFQAGIHYSEFIREDYWGPLPAGFIPKFENGHATSDFMSAIWPAAILAFMMLLAISVGFVTFIHYDVR